MPETTPISKTDTALAASASGALVVSQGPGQIPLADPNQTWLVGVNTLRSVADDTFGVFAQRDNIGQVRPTTAPWSYGYQGHVSGNVTDNVHIMGWIPGTLPSNYGSFTINNENWFGPGDTNGANTLEFHYNYASADGSIAYRPWAAAIYEDTGLWNVEHRIKDTYFYGRDGTSPLLMLQTLGGDGGLITIKNDGTQDPLHILSSDSGSVTFQTGGTGGFAASNVTPATSGATIKNSPFFGLTGHYWNGSASADASLVAQILVASPTSWETRWSVNSPTGAHYWKNNGNVGWNLAGDFYLTESCVIDHGQYAVVRANRSGTQALIGNTNVGGTGVAYVVVDRDGTGTMLGGPVGFNGTPPVAKGAITGSRGGNAALASLLTYLASRGDITDSTTA